MNMGIELMLDVAGESSGSASAPPPPPHLNVGDRCGPNSGVEMRAGSVFNVCSTLKWGARGAHELSPTLRTGGAPGCRRPPTIPGFKGFVNKLGPETDA